MSRLLMISAIAACADPESMLEEIERERERGRERVRDMARRIYGPTLPDSGEEIARLLVDAFDSLTIAGRYAVTLAEQKCVEIMTVAASLEHLSLIVAAIGDHFRRAEERLRSRYDFGELAPVLAEVADKIDGGRKLSRGHECNPYATGRRRARGGSPVMPHGRVDAAAVHKSANSRKGHAGAKR
jgi:hypothetical protein